MVERRAVAGSATYRQVMTCPIRPARPRSSPLTVMRTAPASPTRTSTASVALSVISPPAGTVRSTVTAPSTAARTHTGLSRPQDHAQPSGARRRGG